MQKEKGRDEMKSALQLTNDPTLVYTTHQKNI